MFHISMLRKHVKDDNKKIVPDVTGVTVRADTSYEVKPVRLLAKSTRKRRSRITRIVKVLWSASDLSDATWELEDDVRRDFPHLFEDEVRFMFSFTYCLIVSYYVFMVPYYTYL